MVNDKIYRRCFHLQSMKEAYFDDPVEQKINFEQMACPHRAIYILVYGINSLRTFPSMDRTVHAGMKRTTPFARSRIN